MKVPRSRPLDSPRWCTMQAFTAAPPALQVDPNDARVGGASAPGGPEYRDIRNFTVAEYNAIDEAREYIETAAELLGAQNHDPEQALAKLDAAATMLAAQAAPCTRSGTRAHTSV